MLPRLWLLVGSDRQTDRQCHLLSCPGQLKSQVDQKRILTMKSEELMPLSTLSWCFCACPTRRTRTCASSPTRRCSSDGSTTTWRRSAIFSVSKCVCVCDIFLDDDTFRLAVVAVRGTSRATSRTARSTPNCSARWFTSLPSLPTSSTSPVLLLKMFADRSRWSWCGQERYGEKTFGRESWGLIKNFVRFWWQVEQCDDEVTMPAMVTKQSDGDNLSRRCCAKRTRWDAGSLSPPRLSFFSIAMVFIPLELDKKTAKL